MLTFEGVQAQGTAAIIEKLQVCNIFSKICIQRNFAFKLGEWACVSQQSLKTPQIDSLYNIQT